MKPKHLESISPLRNYYESGNLKSETYLSHLIYIIYRYKDENPSKLISISVNGIEYPPDIELVFDSEANALKLNKKP